MINIEGLDKAEVLSILQRNAQINNPFASSKDLSMEDAREMLKKYTYFDYVYGKPLKVNLSSDKEFDESLYDLNNGEGIAYATVNYIRYKQDLDMLKESGKKIDKSYSENKKNFLPVSILTIDQIQGDKQLDIFKKNSAIAEPTDFDILLGGFGNYGLKNGFVALDVYREPQVLNYSMTHFGEIKHPYSEARNLEYRPVLDISKIINQIGNKIKLENGIGKIEYGEYPQTLADSTISNELEKEYLAKKLNYTGMTYSDYSYPEKTENNDGFIEYEYKGNKYIRVSTLNNKYSRRNINSTNSLSNGEKVKKNHAYWVKVEPLVWLVDLKTSLAVSEKILYKGSFQPLTWAETNNLKDTLKSGDKYFIPEDTYEKSQIFRFLNGFINESIINANNYLDYNNGKIDSDYQADYSSEKHL